jgi:hypothetical protein
MLYQIIAVCVISGIVGAKKPMFGGLAGLILSPLIHLIFYKFDSTIFLYLCPIGLVIGLCSGGIVNWLFFGGTSDINRKPYYNPMSTGKGSSGGGIIYTDEEQKNATENQRHIK